MTKTEAELYRICRHYPSTRRPGQSAIVGTAGMSETTRRLVWELVDNDCYALDADRALPNGDRD